MAELETLRDVAGLGHEACSLAQSAVVLIDCQNTYREGIMKLVGVEAALLECRALLDRARAAGAPVLHIAHDAGSGSPYDISAEIGRIADNVAPQGDEPTIVKHFPSSFHETDLHERLQKIGTRNLIFGGFMTHMCVSSTVRSAYHFGYRSTVVANAAATRDLPSADGGVVKAQHLHEASLAGLGDLFAVVVPKAADLPA